MTARAIIVTLLVALALTPVTPADHGAWTRQGVIFPTVAAYAYSPSEEFALDGLAAGTVVTAVVEWEEGIADLDLFLSAGSCRIFPGPQPDCIVAGTATRVTCANDRSGSTTLGPARERVEITITEAGDYGVVVAHGFGVPNVGVNYVLTVTVDGPHGELSKYPTRTNYVRSDAYCRGLDLAP